MISILNIIFLDNDPNGFKIVEIEGWSGKAFIVPRGRIKEMKNREEIQKPGIYFLFGEGENRPMVYIGQSENLFKRLIGQESNKEKWNIAVIFTGGLDSAYIKNLESISIRFAKKVGRYELDQVNSQENIISEGKKYAVNTYLDNIKFILSFLGYTLFEEIPKEKETKEIYFLEDVHNKDASARGTLLSTGEFVVYVGSKARIQETESFKKHVISSFNLRQRLIKQEILRPLSGTNSYEFTKDYVFTSPSAAADVVHGRACNGWTGWKDRDGKTLDENKRK